MYLTQNQFFIMGLQSFIYTITSLREKLKKEEQKSSSQTELKKCPSCGRDKKEFFKDKFFETLQCPCGLKFYDE